MSGRERPPRETGTRPDGRYRVEGTQGLASSGYGAAAPAAPYGRTVEVDEAVYDLLTRVKRNGETFSDAIRRLLDMPPADGSGALVKGADND